MLHNLYNFLSLNRTLQDSGMRLVCTSTLKNGPMVKLFHICTSYMGLGMYLDKMKEFKHPSQSNFCALGSRNILHGILKRTVCNISQVYDLSHWGQTINACHKSDAFNCLKLSCIYKQHENNVLSNFQT